VVLVLVLVLVLVAVVAAGGYASSGGRSSMST